MENTSFSDNWMNQKCVQIVYAVCAHILWIIIITSHYVSLWSIIYYSNILEMFMLKVPKQQRAWGSTLRYTSLINWLISETLICFDRGLAPVSHHSTGQSFPSWIDACRGCTVEPNPSFTHTVSGLWLEGETAGREREETEKTKVGKETKCRGFSFLLDTSRAFVKKHVKLQPTLTDLWLLSASPHAQHTCRWGGVLT